MNIKEMQIKELTLYSSRKVNTTPEEPTQIVKGKSIRMNDDLPINYQSGPVGSSQREENQVRRTGSKAKLSSARSSRKKSGDWGVWGERTKPHSWSAAKAIK